MNGQPLKLALVAALAVATLSGAAAVQVALNSGGAVQIGAWRPLELAAGYDRAADAAQAKGDAAALARAAELSHRAISLNPYDTASWLRLASIDALQHGRLTPAGAAAFQRAYDLVAIDPYAATWRLGFAMRHWAELPPQAKAEVRAEAMTLAAEREHRPKVLNVLRQVRNPQARMTATLWATRIENTVPRSTHAR